MKIESISYERRASDGAYGNRSFRASAALDEGEDAAAAGDALRWLVCGQMERDVAEEQAREEAVRQARAAEREEEYRRRRVEREAELAREREERAIQQADDTEDDDEDMDDIPFESVGRV